MKNIIAHFFSTLYVTACDLNRFSIMLSQLEL